MWHLALKMSQFSEEQIALMADRLHVAEQALADLRGAFEGTLRGSLPQPVTGVAKPARLDQVRIAAQAGVDPRTVHAAYESRPTRPSLHERVVRAARALGLPEPPDRVG
jgi:hypothetical protein